MSKADQFQALQKQVSSFLLEMLPGAGVMLDAGEESGDGNFACFYSPLIESQELAQFGIRSDSNFILHVAKTETNFTPEIGRNIKLIGVLPGGGDGTARLVRPRTHPSGVDHVFECKSLW